MGKSSRAALWGHNSLRKHPVYLIDIYYPLAGRRVAPNTRVGILLLLALSPPPSIKFPKSFFHRSLMSPPVEGPAGMWQMQIGGGCTTGNEPKKTDFVTELIRALEGIISLY